MKARFVDSILEIFEKITYRESLNNALEFLIADPSQEINCSFVKNIFYSIKEDKFEDTLIIEYEQIEETRKLSFYNKKFLDFLKTFIYYYLNIIEQDSKLIESIYYKRKCSIFF